MLVKDKKNDKVMVATEKYYLHFIKNTTLNTLKKNSENYENSKMIQHLTEKSNCIKW